MYVNEPSLFSASVPWVGKASATAWRVSPPGSLDPLRTPSAAFVKSGVFLATAYVWLAAEGKTLMTVHVKLALPVLPAVSFAETITLYGPCWVNVETTVPVISPVLAPMLRPKGKPVAV